MATVAEIGVRVAADVQGLTSGLATATGSLKTFENQTSSTAAASQAAANKLNGSFSTVGSSLKTLAPAFIAVGAAAVAGITKGIAATTQWAADSRTLQRITGQTAESASGLLGVSSLLGISVGSLSTGFGTLSKSIANGSANFDKYGIATKDATGATLPFDDILGNIIDRFSTLQPGAEQTAFAMNVFGRSGKDLIPILAKGRAGIAELTAKAADLGLVMGQDDLDAAKSLSAAQRELGLAFKGAAISIGQLFIPALTKVVNVATKVIEFFTHLPDPVKEVGVGLALAAGAVGTLTVAFTGLKSTFGPVISGIKDIGSALLESGLLQNAGAAFSSAASGLQAIGTQVEASGAQATDSANATSTALLAVNDAAQAASVAATVNASKATGAFKGLGSSVSSALGSATDAVAGFGATASGLLVPTAALGEATAVAGTSAAAAGGAFSGLGSSIAGLATGPVGIIVAIIAAVVALTVVVVKNWDTIKAWGASIAKSLGFLAPMFAAIRAAFGELVASLGELFTNIRSAFSELGTAFAPLLEALRPLMPLLAPIAKLFAAIALGPFIAALGALVIVLKVLTAIVQTVADGVKFFAHVVAFEVTGAINIAIDAINFFINAYNGLASVVSSIPGLELDHVDALDHVSSASNDAAAATDGVASSASAAIPAVAGLGDAAEGVAGRFRNLAPAFAAIRPLLDAMGTSVKAFRDDAVTAATQAADALASGATEGADAFQKFAEDTLQSATEARQGFQDQMRQALTFTTSMLSALEQAAEQARTTLAGDTSDLNSSQLTALRNQAKITASDILHTFRAATQQTKNFGRDLLEVSKIGGKAGKDLAASLAASGDVLAAQVIADAPKKMQDQIVGAFGKSENAADSFSAKLTNAIVGPLNGILTLLHRIAGHFGVDVVLNDHGAPGQISAIAHGLAALPQQKIIDIILRQHGETKAHSGGLIMHAGGAVKRMHSGGGLASDEVPAVLQRGEFVVRRSAVNHLGLGFMQRINQMHDGGPTAPVGPSWAGPDAADMEKAFDRALERQLKKQRGRLVLDNRRFTRDLDHAVIQDGGW